MNNKLFLILGASLVAGAASAQALSEGFDDITTLAGSGWVLQNNSAPPGSTSWFQGNATVFAAHSGATNSYIGANFNNTTGTNTISNWLIAPTRVWQDGDVVSFYTRTVNSPAFPDRLELRWSGNGSSAFVGTTNVSVGDFTTLLLTVNPNLTTGGYPNTWTQFSTTITGLGGPVSGRMAFRYFVTDGGPSGNNSDYIGIDTVEVVPVPEPATMAGLALGAAALIRRRRKNA
jgi:hypothetical protein